MADLAGEKLLMLKTVTVCAIRQWVSVLKPGRRRYTLPRDQPGNSAQHGGGRSGITLLPALAVPPERKRDGVFICRVLSRNLAALLAWFIVRLTAAQPL